MKHGHAYRGRFVAEYMGMPPRGEDEPRGYIRFDKNGCWSYGPSIRRCRRFATLWEAKKATKWIPDVRIIQIADMLPA